MGLVAPCRGRKTGVEETLTELRGIYFLFSSIVPRFFFDTRFSLVRCSCVVFQANHGKSVITLSLSTRVLQGHALDHVAVITTAPRMEFLSPLLF